MPTQRARRPLPSRLGLAVARPSNVQFVTKGDNEYSRPWRLHRVVDARVEETFDVYENRVVKGFCDQVQRRLRRLIARLKQTPGYSQTAHSAETLARELNDARRAAAFLDEVTPLNHSPERLTMLLLKRPPYRAALEGLIELQRSAAVRLQDSTLDAPLENLPHLYQVWSTLQVVQSLIETAQNAGYVLKLQRLFRRDAGGFFLELIPNGQPLITLFHPVKQTRISLTPERSFGKIGALQSVSFLQKPDITIEIQRPDLPIQLLIFDPKYKLDSESLPPEANEENTGKPKKVDIDKMHAYRDAIRDEFGNHVVRHAAILYPGKNVEYSQGLSALRAYPGEEENLQTQISHVLKSYLIQD